MKKLLICLAMVSIASLALMPRLAHAQPDAGAKARGEYSVPFWSSRSSARRISAAREYPSVAMQPAPVALARVENGYRAFSFQPGTATTNYVIRRTTRAAQPGYMNAGTKATGRY
jgi:hypothetical protein